MSNVLHEENQSHTHSEEPHDLAQPLLSVADFDGNGSVDIADIKDIVFRYDSVDGDDLYHPLYDLNVNGKIDSNDVIKAISTLGDRVPLVDRQIARATQATMKYYGSGGLERAIADGYIPFTQEVQGHGIHYFNFNLATEVGNLEELDIERPVGLNYDNEGNLLAVFYIRVPETQEVTSENPFGNLLVDPEDDFPPSSFDTLTADDWHIHQNFWMTGLGNLNSEFVYGFEEGVPLEATISRLQNTDFQLFPESDKLFSAKFWMLHGWFHSLNPEGTFANLDPNVAIYAPEELGVHAGHHSDNSDPIIAGTDAGEGLFGTDNDDRFNGFGGDDWILGGLGDDSVWGGHGNDWIRGDDDYSSESGDDMLYGGPGDDLIIGHGGSDRLFGGTDNDHLLGGPGDDLLRGGIGYDILTGDEGSDLFVLAASEGTDIITDFELEFDSLVFYTGITSDTVTFTQLDSNTALSFANETIAIINGVNVDDLLAAGDDVFVDV